MPPPVFRAAASTGLMLLAQHQACGATSAVFVSPEAMFVQAASSSRSAEYEVKARYLSLFPEHVTWPAASRQNARQLVIGVVGESPFENQLNDLFAPEKPESRKARIVYITNNLRAIESCDVLFICESESERLYEILRKIKGRPILTLGDSPDFARRGVMINFFLDRDRIAYEVNLPTLRLSGLEMNPQILKKAKIIE